jgi:hypothetical protein
VRESTQAQFAHQNFSHPTKIDNRFFPLVPGTQFIYRGRAGRGAERLPRRVVFTVTDLTKTVDGLRTLVIWDRDYDAGELGEQELAFFAQDDARNIWALGQYVEEYGEGAIDGSSSTWIVGRAGAKPGIHILGNPRTRTPSYSQGYGPAVRWGDIAYVLETGQRNCVPVGCFRNVLVTDETNPLESHDGHQRKYYAPGVGNLRAAPGRGDKEREVLVLVKVRHLRGSALAAARNEALKLDRRAYRLAGRVYGHTSPAKATLRAGRSE